MSVKDIIDIQITVENIDEFDEFKSRMVSRGGNRMKSDYQEDNRPPGDESSSWHWQKRYFREPDGQRRTHLLIFS